MTKWFLKWWNEVISFSETHLTNNCHIFGMFVKSTTYYTTEIKLFLRGKLRRILKFIRVATDFQNCIINQDLTKIYKINDNLTNQNFPSGPFKLMVVYLGSFMDLIGLDSWTFKGPITYLKQYTFRVLENYIDPITLLQGKWINISV